MLYLQTGVIYCDDNLRRLQQLPSGSVDLVYLDPPFFSNRIYEVIWGDEAEVRSFKDRWEGGIQHYIHWIGERLVELRRVLKDTGSLYLHCDPAASHYLKVKMDGVFGAENFRNEIIWQRTSAKGDARRKLPAIHDVILVYGGGPEPYFEPVRREPDAAYRARFRLDDHDGRGPYRLAPLDSPNPRPNLTYEYKGYQPPAKGWRVSYDVMADLDADGRLAFPADPAGRIARKHYLQEQDWPTVGDVWTDINPIQAASAERVGYPTQKPEALLERIIQCASRPGDVVLDPFCGCGTTLAVAHKTQRRWIGIDISPTAVGIIGQRLAKLGASVAVEGLPTTVADLKQLAPFEFQKWIIQRVYGEETPRKSGDMGIDGYSFFERLPIQIKQSERVGRNVVDNFETAVERSGKHEGFIVAFSFTAGAFEEAARANAAGKVKITLVRVEDVIRFSSLLESASLLEFYTVAQETHQNAPDLMKLFSGATRPLRERPITGPASGSRPSARQLIESDNAHSSV